jgi:hypothetical protein
MFGTVTKNSGYTSKITTGSDYLRTIIERNVYSGDPVVTAKLTQYQLYWNFYNNRHWAENNDKLLSFNYCRALLDKIVDFTLGKKLFEVNVEDTWGGDVPEQVETSIENFLNYNWRLNKKKSLVRKIFQMGGVCGDVYVFLSYNRDNQFIEYRVLDSRYVVPKFDQNDYEKIEYYRYIRRLGLNHPKEYTVEITEYRSDRVVRYFQKDVAEQADRFEIREEINPLGFVPIVHIENMPMSDGFGGASDLVDIIKLNKIYNELTEDIKAIIDYYAQPVTVITGGNAGVLKRGIGELWSGLPSEANVFNLGLNDDLSGSHLFLKLVKDAIHDMSGVPEEILSKVNHISNTSAAALQMMYSSLIQAADKKVVTYSEGLEELHAMTFQMARAVDLQHPLYRNLPINAVQDERYFNRYRAVPVFTYNLPNDRLAQLNEINLEVQLKIASRREVMERLGKKDIPKLLSEIEKDQQQLAEWEKLGVPEQDARPTQLTKTAKPQSNVSSGG